MRTNVVLDDELVAEAMRMTGIRTRKALIDEALRQLVHKAADARRREQYDDRVSDLQRRTSRLVLRESAHDLIRADRERR